MWAVSIPNPNPSATMAAAMKVPEMSGRTIKPLSCIRIRYDCPTSWKLRPMRPILRLLAVEVWRCHITVSFIDAMRTTDTSPALARLFLELVDGASGSGGAFILNSGDAGLLRSLDKLSAADASRSVNGGATIAAHAQHLRYGLSLMNRWATEGGHPFAN